MTPHFDHVAGVVVVPAAVAERWVSRLEFAKAAAVELDDSATAMELDEMIRYFTPPPHVWRVGDRFCVNLKSSRVLTVKSVVMDGERTVLSYQEPFASQFYIDAEWCVPIPPDDTVNIDGGGT